MALTLAPPGCVSTPSRPAPTASSGCSMREEAQQSKAWAPHKAASSMGAGHISQELFQSCQRVVSNLVRGFITDMAIQLQQ